METEYELGDLLVIHIDENVHTNQVMGIYKSYDETMDRVTIYPLDKEGLQLAKYDADEAQTGFYRTTPYEIAGFKKSKVTLIENPYLTLDSAQTYYYEQIIARL